MSPAVSVNTSGRRARLRLLHRWIPPAEIILPDVSARGLFWQQLLLWLQGGFASRNTFGTKNPELSIPHAVTLTLAQLLSPLVTQSVTGSFFGLLKTPLMNPELIIFVQMLLVEDGLPKFRGGQGDKRQLFTQNVTRAAAKSPRAFDSILKLSHNLKPPRTPDPSPFTPIYEDITIESW